MNTQASTQAHALGNACRCGAAEGLEAGRHCLNKWGFRRVEDICWIKVGARQHACVHAPVHVCV